MYLLRHIWYHHHPLPPCHDYPRLSRLTDRPRHVHRHALSLGHLPRLAHVYLWHHAWLGLLSHHLSLLRPTHTLHPSWLDHQPWLMFTHLPLGSHLLALACLLLLYHRPKSVNKTGLVLRYEAQVSLLVVRIYKNQNFNITRLRYIRDYIVIFC